MNPTSGTSPPSDPAPPTVALAPAPADPLDTFFYEPGESVTGIAEFLEQEPAPAAVPDEAPQQFLAFRLTGKIYAVPLERIREIARAPPITEVPRAPSFVLGVMSLRGDIIPVFDAHRRLGLPRPSKSGPKARVVLVETGEGPAGLLVDGVEQVVRLRSSTFEAPVPGMSLGIDGEYVTGIARHRDQKIVLLNLTTLLAMPARGDR